MKTKLLALGALFASLCASVQGQVDKTPVLAMSFDKVSGTTAGSIVTNTGSGGLGMNGTLNGGASIVPGGRFGNALQVVGVASPDASVRIANAVVPLTVAAGSAWTVACWIQSTTQGGTWMYQGNGGWAVDNTTFAMVVNNGTTGVNGHAAGGVRNSRGWQQGTTVVDDGAWHHIVFTFDGTTKVQYVDGVVDTWVANQWNNTPAATGNQFWIGGGGTGQNDGQVCLNGLIDEVYVFNQALNANDVQGLFTANTLPIVPVAVTLNPSSGYRGQTFTISATVTPASGTVTNVSANLSAINLSAATNLVLSSGNVYTNTFTVPATAPVGARVLTATARTTTDPFIGSGGATFTVIARPPTNAIIVSQITNVLTTFEYGEASFRFITTNDAPNDAPFPMTFEWYKNGVRVDTNAMGPLFTFLATPADNGAQIQAIARVADTNFSSIGSMSVTSAVATLTVNPGSVIFTNGLKRELFAGATRPRVERGDVGPGVVDFVSQLELPGGLGDNYAARYSGYFIAPSNSAYAFFLACDDDTDLFLSTDSNPANKQLIAQENGWSGTLNWFTVGGGGSIASQKRSDQWTNSVGVAPFASGINLVAGQKYYMEVVFHQGTGGDNFAVTYQTIPEINDPQWPVLFANGTNSRLTAASQTLALVTWPGTNISMVLQPLPATVFEGNTATFTARATSSSEMTVAYQWYVNGVPSGGDSTNLALPFVDLSLNNAQIKVVASTREGNPTLSVTSSVVTLTVQQAVLEVGFAKEEKWFGLTSRATIVNGTIGAPSFSIAMPAFAQGDGNPGGQGDFGMRLTGFFIPPTSGNYVFFIASDDDSDLFLSTDNKPANKRQIAQEAGWNNLWNWTTAGGGGSVASQMRSDQFVTNGVLVNPLNIPLVAGQKYYMEVDHHNGAAGGTHVGVYYKLETDLDPAVGTLPNTVGSRIAVNAPRSFWVAFTGVPTNVTVQPFGFANFGVSGTTDSTFPISTIITGNEATRTNNFFAYRWLKNGTIISNQTSSTLNYGPVLPSDNGAQIVCQIRSLGYSDNALNPIWSNSPAATITVSPEAVYEPGWAQVEWWPTGNVSRVNVENGIAGSAAFKYAIPKLAYGGDYGNNYANRFSGFFVPPANGNYVFYMNSDDDGDLFLSTDDSPLNKRLIALERGWSGGTLGWQQTGGGGDTLATRRSDQFTDPATGTQPYTTGIPLVAGQKYYLEGVHHDGGGGEVFAVTYTFLGDAAPANGTDTLIQSNAVGFLAPRVPWVAFLQQPQPQIATSGGNSVTFGVQGTNAPASVVPGSDVGDPRPYAFNNRTNFLLYQWYKNGVPIAGATKGTYTQTPILPSDNGAQFSVQIRTLGYANNSLVPIWSNSAPAVLTVVTDTVPPTINYAATFVNTNQNPAQFIVNVTFNEWMDSVTAGNAGNYSIAGSTIIGASLNPDHRTVQLLLTAAPTLPVNVVVTGVKDLSGNTIVASSSASINSQPLTFTDVGTPGTDPAYPSIVSVVGNGNYLISAQGHDIWDTADGFNFAWEMKTNDFDVAVRGVSITKTDQNAKMGLMVRQDLTPGSPNWSIVNTPSSADGIPAVNGSGNGANSVDVNTRQGFGLATGSWRTNANPIPRYPNAWVRLTRTGSVLRALSSSNRVDWVLLGTYETATNVNGALPAEVYVGLATTAHANDSIVAPLPPPYRFYNTAEYADYTSSFVANAKLSVSKSGNNLIISWAPTGGHLESSPALVGPGVNWQPVGSANPATVPIGAGPQYFRVVNP